MDEARITITLKPKHVERGLYWVIILILGFLLILSYMDDTEPAIKTTTVEEEPEAIVTPPPETVVADPDETCDDTIKNQDETAVDCGGSCPGCESGQTCETAADCAGDYCVANKCTNTAPVTLSGSVEVKITSVTTEVVEGSGAARVTSVAYQIDNGLEDDLGLINVRVFLKSKRDTGFCLSQLSGEEFDCPNSYASWTTTGPRSGKVLKESVTLDRKYTSSTLVTNWGSSTYYDHGDEFNLFIYVYDGEGEKIGGKSLSAFKTVTP